MTWTLTDDPQKFARHARPLLAARPVENTVPLTVLDGVLAGRRYTAEAMIFGWYDEGGAPAGAVCMTPPFELLLAVVPDRTLDELVAVLRAAAVAIPGVNGDEHVVDAFAEAWTTGTSWRPRTGMQQRLYKLDALRPPTPQPPGRGRPAYPEDLELTLRWTEAFHLEAGSREVVIEAAARDQIADGRLWVWEDATATPVSFSGRQKTTAGVARVGPVYTPPEHRRRGFGEAVTAACTADALRCDVDEVVLFTDLANPTSNAIYRRIGFRPVGDRKVIRFIGPPPERADGSSVG